MTAPATGSGDGADASPAEPRTALPRTVRVLAWTSFLNDVASEMIYPLLPTFLLHEIGATRTALGAIEGVADSLSSLLKLWFGALSDRLSRRKTFVVAGYAVAALVRPMIGFAALTWEVFAARAGDRAGKGMRSAPRDALIADSTPATMRGRAFGLQKTYDHLGAALGPLLAFVLLRFWIDDLRTLFVLTIIPGVLVILLVMWGVRETPVVASDKPRPRLSLQLKPLGRPFRGYLAALLVFTLGNSSDIFLLIRAEEVGIPTEQLPLLWCSFHIVKSFGTHLAGRAVDRLGSRPLILSGWTIYAILYAAFAVASAPWQVWVMMSLYALFHALTEPAEKTLLVGLVPADQRGLAFGWYHCTVGLGALPASLIFGAIYERLGPFAAFGWGAALALLATLVLALGARPAKSTPPVS